MYKSNAKTIRGLFLGLVYKFREDAKNNITYSALELEQVFTEALRKFNGLYPKSIIKVEIDGWKGKDSYDIYRGVDGIFRVNEYRRNKETEEISLTSSNEVNAENINYLLGIIKPLPCGERYYAQYFWKRIISHYDLRKEGVDLRNFNGGGNMRSKYYFPYYMLPLKCIEWLKLVDIIDSKGGGIIKIK